MPVASPGQLFSMAFGTECWATIMQTRAGCGAQHGQGAGQVKENTLLLELRISPRTDIPSASGRCSCHHSSLWPLYHRPDIKEVFSISWISLDWLCCDMDTQKLLGRNISTALTATVFPCSPHYSIPPVPLKPPYSSAAQLRGCWPQDPL